VHDSWYKLVVQAWYKLVVQAWYKLVVQAWYKLVVQAWYKLVVWGLLHFCTIRNLPSVICTKHLYKLLQRPSHCKALFSKHDGSASYRSCDAIDTGGHNT